ncbi:HIRAN domain-containing protein [uncultured Thiodictyon sp.]|uniref:HIRAN domain-containing protein n=1 Tax=uncultured Thiodictyon sp. TaxID=1846217 RepID=UPI0025E85215|nr:HIRAN domain-containing protein [uncultured Thiodictyon sp.]
MRARLWLRGDWLGQRNEQSFLWLHLNDGRVLAFRLPTAALADDEPIGALVEQFAQDQRGTLLEARFGDGVAIPLYAAPAAPLPALPWGDPRHHAARDFAAGLDQEVLSLLASLNRHRQWDSLRNYNRLAALAPERRSRRLQAVTRFPLLAAPVLLSAHRYLEFAGGKRHAWRNHDARVLEAIDWGRDLTGALARHYGISKGLVRSPICAQMWGDTALSHRRLLRLLDGIPAHRRPRACGEFTQAIDLFNLTNLLDDDADLVRLGATAFREGLEAVCAPLQERFAPLGPAFADCFDFIRAALERARQAHPCPRGLTAHRLELAWIESRGFRSLLVASRRWHERVWDQADPEQNWDQQDRTRIAAILGEHQEGEAHGRELCEAAVLVREGETMHHCVAQYWAECRDRGTRIFALGIGAERATAQYQFTLSEARFSLAQLRGPHNAQASGPLMAFAQAILTELNALGRAPARAELALDLSARRAGQSSAPRQTRRLDPAGERELAAVLAHLRPALADGELLRDFIAGYQFHGGTELEPQMDVGDTLELVREPDNPHDPQAVAVRWGGERIGYIPRRVNADIARRLDAAEHLVGHLTRLDAHADTWGRVEFAIRQAPAH